jgi:hypothetical protein
MLRRQTGSPRTSPRLQSWVDDQRHTTHPVQWTRISETDSVTRKLDLKYVVTCEECEEEWTFEAESEAETFHEEHTAVTDHEPDGIEYVERPISPDRPADLLKLIERLDRRTGGDFGVPGELVIRAAVHRGGDHQQVRNWLDRLSRSGQVVTPVDGQYRTV